MQRANRFLDTVRSVRLQHAILALFTVLVLAYGTIAFRSVWRVSDQLLETAASTIGVAALTGFGLFAVAALAFAWLMSGTLDRQQRALGELRRREQELTDQGALLQSTLENMGEGISVFDRHGRLIAWNARFVEILELPQPAGLTSLYDILLYQARRGDFGPVDPVSEARERIEQFYRDLPHVRERVTASGRTLLIHRRSMPDGAVVSLYSDITERKAAEQTMAEAWQAAEAANRTKSDFLANMSHELRTPLNAIIGFSEVICSEFLGPMRDKKYLGYINDIHSSGLHLLSIINDVLDMSKIEAGKLELASEIVTVPRILAESLRMVSERAHSRNIELVSEIAGADTGIWGDERAIKQIVLNLLSNAVKFSHDGGRVDIRATLADDGGLILEVEDRGIGMSPGELERALQPFGQANTGAARLYGGTGLGLPITKGLIDAHHGELLIDTAPNRGTRVRVSLPPHVAATTPAPSPAPPPKALSSGEDRAVA
ncbi:MAG: PAS-domain containing protein [Alphaproteobacteria bacterium]|nr:PAS-domain containing protein [Alphaproteobacteria bacterium]MBV9154124.1 PAS-domain containing protein [Alphaproteobacteria bacterium]MBV9967870.1 PAS-domain containing protein [Alphaproteobacteria bacterium]